MAHEEGVNGLSWGPSTDPAMLTSKNSVSGEKKFSLPPKRLASGGNDHKVLVWEFKSDGEQKPTKTEVGGHDDWVRDVSWCGSMGLAYDMIASVSEDKTCKVWKLDSKTSKLSWSEKKISFEPKVPLWKVSWS